tara:strand:+ start:358 stop:678 length:321 start_codon:yes stop_codon:yes gene_type:complete
MFDPDPYFESNDTMAALEVVGFYPKYGQIDGGVWSFHVDSLSRDDAVDAEARLLNAMLLQALPEWHCAVMDKDVKGLYHSIKAHHGPFSNMEISNAMMRVELKLAE